MTLRHSILMITLLVNNYDTCYFAVLLFANIQQRIPIHNMKLLFLNSLGEICNKYPSTVHISSLNKYAACVLGARLASNRKFAAFSGDVRTTVYDGTSRDHLCEQLPPVEQWGFTYYTVRYISCFHTNAV